MAKERATAIIVKGDEILLMGRVRDGKKYFVFPGGGIEDGEDREKAVLREVKEELNLETKIDRLLFELDDDRHYFFYLFTEFSGNPEVVGEEKDRSSENNVYIPTWKKINELKTLDNLFPEKGIDKLISILSSPMFYN